MHPLTHRSFRSIRPSHPIKVHTSTYTQEFQINQATSPHHSTYIHPETAVSDQSDHLTPSQYIHPPRDSCFRSIRPPHTITVHTSTQRQLFQINQATSPHHSTYIHPETGVSDQSGHLTPSQYIHPPRDSCFRSIRPPHPITVHTSTQRQVFQINQATSRSPHHSTYIHPETGVSDQSGHLTVTPSQYIHPPRDSCFRSIRPPHPITVHTSTQRQLFQINQATSPHHSTYIHPETAVSDQSGHLTVTPSQYIHPPRDSCFRSIRPPHPITVHTSTQRQLFQINQATSRSPHHSTYIHPETAVSDQSDHLTVTPSQYIHPPRDSCFRSIRPPHGHPITVHTSTQRQLFQINQTTSPHHSTYIHPETAVSDQSDHLTVTPSQYIHPPRDIRMDV